jgi:hypothetical protein
MTGTCVTTPGDTYNVPITFNVYNVGTGNVVGTQIVSVTQTFAIPYRPSADNVMLYPSDANAPVATQPTVGTFPLPNDAYADHTSGTTFPFQFNAGGYGGTQPAVQFTAN